VLTYEDDTRFGTVPAPGLIIRLSVPLPFREALKHIERAFLAEGFELSQRVALSSLVKDRVGVEVSPAELLTLVHPVLAFQALLAGDKASTFLQLFVVVKRSSENFSSVSFHTASDEGENYDDALTRFVAQQAHARFLQAAHRIRQLSSPADTSTQLPC
jgi:uncharacterized protein (DUF302 family)